MLKWKSRRLLLALALTGVCLPQTATKYSTPEIRRVGEKLACKCGACNNTVAACPMIECHYALPAREKIAAMQAQGVSDQNIVDSFVKESGIVALAIPPTEGFHLLGWVMPFIAIALGLGAIALWFRRFSRPRAATATAEPVIDRRYQDRIDKELQELE